MSRVVRLRGPDGAEWIAKQHQDAGRYRAELEAYQQWAPALGSRAPVLRAHDDHIGAILISALAGRVAAWPGPSPSGGTGQADELAVHHDAGVALRLLHDAQPPRPCPDLGAVKTAELGQLAPQAGGLLSNRELAFAASAAAALTATGPVGLVPCHGDYTPRNWLADRGRVRVIDFEWARLDAPHADLARLYLAIWQARPDLRTAFLDGYGRPLDDRASVLLRGCAAVRAVWLIVKARQTSQPSFEQASRAALGHLMTNPA
jgi:aminoglycoside phosphotransferase